LGFLEFDIHSFYGDPLPQEKVRFKQFRNYCGLIRIARCGFHWKKTTKRPIASASFYANCEIAVAGWGLQRPGAGYLIDLSATYSRDYHP